jgi:hypothetical protein
MADDGTMLRRATALLTCCLALACSGQSSTPTSAGSATSSAPKATSKPSSTSTAAAGLRLSARLASWRLPSARSREVVEATAAGLVVAGGLSSAHVSTSTAWTLEPGTGRLANTSALAEAVHDAAGAVLNRNAVVVAGGNTSTVDALQQVETGSTTARVIGHLPQPRSDLGATTLGGALYVLGGFDGTTSLRPVLRSTDGQHFTTVAQLPLTVRYAAVVGMVSPSGDRLLVFGGEHNGVAVDDVQEIDVRSGRARIVGHLPAPLAHESAFVLGNAVWLAGGRSNSVLQSRIWRWNPAAHRTSAAGRLPYAVADAGCAVVGSTAYVVGGETPDPTDRVLELRAAG